MLYNFYGPALGDGMNPWAPLMESANGVLYGTTYDGGSADKNPTDESYGTVFAINKDGSGYRVLYSFGGTPSDGGRPAGGLVEGSDGALYGITTGEGLLPMNGGFYGTTVSGGVTNQGTVFRLSLTSTSPVLAIAQTNSTLTLSWPYPSTGFVLESTLSLSSPSWQPAPETPVSTNGQWQVRLHEP